MKLNYIYKEINAHSHHTMMNESRSLITKTIKDLFSKSYGKVKLAITKASREMIRYLKKSGLEKESLDIISQYTGKTYNSLDQLVRVPIKEDINEGFKEWFDEAKGNAYNALAFYPLLTMFLEFDKLIKGNPDASLKITLIYFIIWVGIVTGKVVSDRLSQKSKIKALGSKA